MTRMIDTRCLLLGLIAIIAVLTERHEISQKAEPTITGSIRRLHSVDERHGIDVLFRDLCLYVENRG